MALKLEVFIEADTDGDIETALDEVRRLVAAGFLSGMDSNDSGHFNFQIKGKEEPAKESDDE